LTVCMVRKYPMVMMYTARHMRNVAY
jgi:hypothetical protein